MRTITNNRFIQPNGRWFSVIGVGTFVPEARSWIRNGL
jgi:hypothetical protein